MRYLKMLGLVSTAVALLALGATAPASATVLCSTIETPCTAHRWANTSTDWSLQQGTTARISSTEGQVLNSCSGSTLRGTIFNGSASSTVDVSVNTSELTWSECSFSTKTLAGGPSKSIICPKTSTAQLQQRNFK